MDLESRGPRHCISDLEGQGLDVEGRRPYVLLEDTERGEYGSPD